MTFCRSASFSRNARRCSARLVTQFGGSAGLAASGGLVISSSSGARGSAERSGSIGWSGWRRRSSESAATARRRGPAVICSQARRSSIASARLPSIRAYASWRAPAEAATRACRPAVSGSAAACASEDGQERQSAGNSQVSRLKRTVKTVRKVEHLHGSQQRPALAARPAAAGGAARPQRPTIEFWPTHG